MIETSQDNVYCQGNISDLIKQTIKERKNFVYTKHGSLINKIQYLK